MSSYDTVIIGDAFAGLITATLCANRGKRCLLVRTTEQPFAYHLGEHALPTRALTLAGLHTPFVTRVIDELHFGHMLKRKLRQAPARVQLVGPDIRLDLSDDNHGQAKSWQRELAIDDSYWQQATLISQELDTLFDEGLTLPALGFKGKRETNRRGAALAENAAQWAAAPTEDSVLRSLLRLPGALGSNHTAEGLSPLAAARAFALWRQGCPRVDGDWQTLENAFLEKFASHGGEVRTARAREVHLSWNKVRSVTLENGEELGTEHMVYAGPVDDLQELLPAKAAKKCADVSSAVAGKRYTLNVLVAGRGIPLGMAPTVLALRDPHKPLTDGNAFSVHVGQPDNEGRIWLTVETAEVDNNQNVRQTLRDNLNELMPFLDQHTLMVHSPCDAIPAEGPHSSLELPPTQQDDPIWSTTDNNRASFGLACDGLAVGVKRLLVASPQMTPGLGIEGAFMTAWSAANQVCGKPRQQTVVAK